MAQWRSCGVAAGADYVVTRDDDLLSLGTYEGIPIVTSEVFPPILRCAE
jgi:predicted nucleic acid-binding protein